MKTSKKLWILIFIIIIANIVYYLGQWGGDKALQLVSDSLPILCSFIAVVCLYRAYKVLQERDFTKIAWLMLLVGTFLFFLGESTYALLEITFKVDMNEYFPSIADYFWCAGYIPMLIGLAMMLSGYKKSGLPMGNSKLYLAMTLGFSLLVATIIYFLLIPIIDDSGTNFISKVIYLFYPIADLFMLLPAILLMYITSLFGIGTISKPWKYLAFGFLFITVADMLYAYLGWQDLYGNGNLIDVIWHSGYLLIGLAGLYQSELIESLKEG